MIFYIQICQMTKMVFFWGVTSKVKQRHLRQTRLINVSRFDAEHARKPRGCSAIELAW